VVAVLVAAGVCAVVAVVDSSPTDAGVARRDATLTLLHAEWGPTLKIAQFDAAIATVVGSRERRARTSAPADFEKERSSAPRLSRTQRNLLTERGSVGRLRVPQRATDSTSPQWSFRFQPGVEGVDPMVAVGEKSVVVTQDHRIAFFDKQGNPLQPKFGVPTNVSATNFFRAFWAPKLKDGTVNQSNINLHLGAASAACDATVDPPSSPCIWEWYDTKVLYDRITKRFVILAPARNLWKNTTKPGYENPNGIWNDLARRYFAFAVSRTQDPRDGFHQYMTMGIAGSNYSDGPRIAVSNGSLIVAHASPESGKPVAYVFSLQDAAAGKLTVGNFTYAASAIGGGGVVPVTSFGDSGGLTFLVRANKTKNVTVFAFPQPANASTAPALQQDAVSVDWVLGTASLKAPVYRNGTIYGTSMVEVTPLVPNQKPQRMCVRVLRIPVEKVSQAAINVPSNKLSDICFGRSAVDDAPTDLISYELPAIAVTKAGDMIIVYGRIGIETVQTLYPQVRYSAWYHGEAKRRWSRVMQLGNWALPATKHTYGGQTETIATATHYYDKGRLDFAAATVDPVDDATIWMIHAFGSQSYGGLKAVIAKVKP